MTSVFEPRSSSPLRRLFKPSHWAAAITILTICAFFIFDVLMPRGATPAIAYVLVPVVAGNSKKRWVVAATVICSILTWVGYFLEGPGAAWWMSVFDRVMVTGALWVATVLVLRRLALMNALAQRTAEMERTSAELSRSNAELDRFTSRVAHDLRAPLNGIALGTQLLASNCGQMDDPESRELTVSVTAQIEQMSQLIHSLLSYGRVGGGELRRTTCDCQVVLSGVLRALSMSLTASAAVVTQDALPTVVADPVLVGELMQNLIENAIKYRSNAAPRIHISAVRQESGWVFSFRDNGIGISAADQQEVFRPFTQIDGCGTRRGGVGLGLATCRRIVERHGGNIWVESAPGEGSTFHFTLAG